MATTAPPVAPVPASQPQKVAVVDADREQRGIGQNGNLTVEQMLAKPKLGDGGVEAVVGPAKGEEPEVIATATPPPEAEPSEPQGDDDGDSKSSKLSWLKRLTPGSNSNDKSSPTSTDRSRSASILSSASATQDATPSPAVNPLPAVAPGAQKVQEPVQPTTVVTDNSGVPVPVDVGLAPAAAPSVTTSLRDDLSDMHDLDPATSEQKFHQLFSQIPQSEELIEGEFELDSMTTGSAPAERRNPVECSAR